MTIIGIDPGLSGAMAFLEGYPPNNTLHVKDMPVFNLSTNGGKRREINILALDSIIRLAPRPCHAFLEKVHGRPKMGGAAMFSFGKTAGIVEALLVAHAIPYDLVTPQAWKKNLMDGQATDKDASRQKVIMFFPEYAELFANKKDHGRADATLIAIHGRRTIGHANN